MKENEENRGINNKKASKDQWLAFCLFIFGALIFNLLFSHTLAHLEHSFRT